MELRTRSQDLQLTEPVKNPEALIRGRTPSSGSTEVKSNNDDSRPQGSDESTQT